MNATTEKKATPKALETYQAHRADIARLIDWLQMELDKSDEQARIDPLNWGHAGSMGQVRSNLIDTLEFISGIERARIEETLGE